MFEDLFERRSNKKADITSLLPKKLPYLIHVAGTNGKGSTCSYLESVLMQKYKVGKFTSPHVLSVTERITINQVEISNAELKNRYDKIKNLDLGFFDFLFIIAMNYFVEQNVDICIIEVGIGGRFDVTNQIKYDVALITNVSIDHTAILGSTIKEIAYQKAGIAKNNTKTFYTDLQLKDEIEKETNNSKFLKKNTLFTLPLIGEHQQKNFALAYEVFKNFNISDSEIKKGLNEIKIIGREQWIKEDVLIDVAHNIASITELKNLLLKLKNKKIQIFLSVLKDKDLKSIYNILKKTNHHISIVPMPDIKRGRTKENILNTLGNVEICYNITPIKNMINVYCGSFYFIQKVLYTINS